MIKKFINDIRYGDGCTAMVWTMTIIVVSFLALTFYHQTALDNAYKQGALTLTQYCDAATNHGTSRTLPVACHQVYGFKPTAAN